MTLRPEEYDRRCLCGHTLREHRPAVALGRPRPCQSCSVDYRYVKGERVAVPACANFQLTPLKKERKAKAVPVPPDDPSRLLDISDIPLKGQRL